MKYLLWIVIGSLVAVTLSTGCTDVLTPVSPSQMIEVPATGRATEGSTVSILD